MRTGGHLLVTAAVLACTACLGGGGKLEVRSVNNGLKADGQPVPYRIAEARGQLAIGNVALALEGFRKAERDDPASADALAGIAQCYDEMGRFDLSRSYYERALALAPRDPALLGLFAASLDRQGRGAEARAVRAEVAALAVVETPPSESDAVEAARQLAELPEPAAPVVALPAPQAVAASPVGQTVTVALAPPRPAEPSAIAPKAPPPAAVAPPVGRSVTVALAPPRPATASRQPRIERLSLTEVALFTGDGPRWKRPVPAPMLARRAVPVRQAELRILNAARVEKLAARTRAYLGRFGWREVAIGDAADVRRRSLIVYPAEQREMAAKLAARTGIAMAERPGVRVVTMLLGRDAAGHPALRPRA